MQRRSEWVALLAPPRHRSAGAPPSLIVFRAANPHTYLSVVLRRHFTVRTILIRTGDRQHSSVKSLPQAKEPRLAKAHWHSQPRLSAGHPALGLLPCVTAFRQHSFSEHPLVVYGNEHAPAMRCGFSTRCLVHSSSNCTRCVNLREVHQPADRDRGRGQASVFSPSSNSTAMTMNDVVEGIL